MPNPLTTLLELAIRESGHGPEFYRCLLKSEVYALLPADGNGLDEGKARFVMWSDGNGARVIPFFSSRAAVRRALKPELVALRMTGLQFLRLTRGANVVLDPNEAASCHMTPTEVAALLAPGDVSLPPMGPGHQKTPSLLAVPHPPHVTLQTLSALFAANTSVLRAYLVYYWQPDEPEKRRYLVAVLTEPTDNQHLARESTQVIIDAPPDLEMDFMGFDKNEHPLLQEIRRLTEPFYDRCWSEHPVVPPSGRLN